MRYLLDTHIALWAIAATDKLPAEIVAILEDEDNEIFYSVASVWEIAIKNSVHPDKITLKAEQFSTYCKEMCFEEMPISDRHIFCLTTLHRDPNAPKHNDPFDRLLIAQAKSEKIKFITHDKLLPYYNESCVMFI